MWRVLVVSLFAFGLSVNSNSLAQPVSVTWQLTNSALSTSSQPALAVGTNQQLAGGVSPTVVIFDYMNGQAQRLNAGSTGWNAGPPSPTRYLQFDAAPTPGSQLTVNSVSFNFGEANVNNQIRADVRYSTDNWATSTLISSGIAYPPQGMVQFTAAVTAPPVTSAGKFSLRILPYAIINSLAGAPTFAAHNQVTINADATTVTVPEVRLQITKSTGAAVIPGTYSFNLACTGPGGPYTGTNAINITLPGPPAIVGVPQGDTCTLTETPVPNWNPPLFGGSNSPVNPVAPWSAQIGPMNVNTTLTVTNQPVVRPPPQVRLQITKSTGAAVIPGTYSFNLACTGPGGPYTGTNPINITLPGPPAIVGVPQGDTCTLTETPVPNWNPPLFGGSNSPVNPVAPWSAQIGPMNVNTTLTVTNQPVVRPPPQVRLQITKSTGATVIPGTYSFNLACTGPGGPYTGTNPINITLPGPPAIVGVPQGDTCTLTETPVPNWNPPLFGGSNSPVNPVAPWSAQIGPMNVNTTLTVTNQPVVRPPPQVRLQITKSTGATVIPGTYSFNLACTGPGGPYTGTNPINITLPGPPAIVGVPQGDTCTLTETPVPNWNPPLFGGSNSPVNPVAPWSAQIGPMNLNSTLTVTNLPPKPSANANFEIRKNFQGVQVPGTYTFSVSCSGGYAGPATVSVVVPNPGSSSINVPMGATCTLTESPVSGWNPPLFGGSGQPINPVAPWQAIIGPINANDRVIVTNRP